MNNEEIRHGSTVWITGGLDKGRKGIVETKGFGQVSVVLEGETKIFSQFSVTTKDPNQHIPLPPNFLPLDFKLGDKVEVHDHWSKQFNGVVGVVRKLPISASRGSDFSDRAYWVEVTKPERSGYDPGKLLNFNASELKTASKDQRVEGEEINHEDVRVGDIIRTELRSDDGSYTQVSSKEGKVNRVTKKLHATGQDPAVVFSFQSERHHGLTFGMPHEQIFLVKAAEDPYKAIVEGLTSGTIVVRENDNGVYSTFVKSPDSMGSSQWHTINSISTRSSFFVTDSDIIRILGEGKAEFVHKVRKKVIPAPPKF